MHVGTGKGGDLLQVSVEAQRGAKEAGRRAASGGKRAAREAQSAAQQAAPRQGGLFGRAKPPAGGPISRQLTPLTHCLSQPAFTHALNMLGRIACKVLPTCMKFQKRASCSCEHVCVCVQRSLSKRATL